MTMIERPNHEDITTDSHHREHRRTHDAEANNAPQDDVSCPHRLGHDRVNGFRLEFSREAERAQQQGDHQDEIARRGKHKLKVELGRISMVGLQKPAGKQQD